MSSLNNLTDVERAACEVLVEGIRMSHFGEANVTVSYAGHVDWIDVRMTSADSKYFPVNNARVLMDEHVYLRDKTLRQSTHPADRVRRLIDEMREAVRREGTTQDDLEALDHD